MGNADKLSAELLEAMSGGVDQMTDGGESIPAAKASGVVRVSERPDEADDNRMLTPSLLPKAVGDIRGAVFSLKALGGMIEGYHDEDEE